MIFKIDEQESTSSQPVKTGRVNRSLFRMRRKRAERLNQIQSTAPGATTTNAPAMRREFSSHRS